MTPLLSVVIPTIGRRSLEKAVKSALDNLAHTEVIVVVDRASELENVKLLLKGLPCRIVRGRGIGSAAARNTGMDLATGDFLAFLDDDDTWNTHKADRQIARILAAVNPELTLCGASIAFRDSKNKIRRQSKPRFSGNPDSVPNYLISRRNVRFRGNSYCSSALLGKRTFLVKSRWNEDQNDHDDWQYLIDLVNDHKAEAVIETAALVEIRQGSLGSISAERNWPRSMLFWDKNRKLFSNRATNDFLLIFVILPSLVRLDFHGISEGCKRLTPAMPSLAALLRFIAGLVLRR
jgi:glycosyltransferase involved in cell wall biosynthesis